MTVFASGFDDTGSDEQAVGSGTSVAHPAGVVLEVAQGGRELVFLDAFQGIEAGGGADAVDVP